MKVRFTPPPQAEVSRGMKVPYGPGRRPAVQWRWLVILALVASPFVYLLFSLAWPYLMVTAPGVVVLGKESVTAASAGVVHTVHVRPGDPVRTGQPLVTLHSAALDERMAAVRAALSEPAPAPAAAATADGKGTERQAAVEELLQLAEHTAARQAGRLAVVRGLLAEGAATVAEVETVAAQADSARHALLQARQQVQAARRDQAPVAVEAVARPDRQRLQAQLEALTIEQQGLVARSPLTGRVLDTPVEVGQPVAPGALLAQVAAPGRSHVVAYLRPAAQDKAAPGREVTVRLPNGRSVAAKVREQPSRVGLLPAGFTATLGNSREPMLLVALDLAEPLPADQAIEGLPVQVRFPWF